MLPAIEVDCGSNNDDEGWLMQIASSMKNAALKGAGCEDITIPTTI